MPDEIDVRVKFTATTPYGAFTDALYFGVDTFEAVSQAEIDAQKQTRVAAFVAAVEAAQNAPEPDPTVEVESEDGEIVYA